MIQINAHEGCVVNVTDKPITNILVMGDMVQTKTVVPLPASAHEGTSEAVSPAAASAGAGAMSPLLTPEAMHLWEIAQQHGWVDAGLKPLISHNKAAILASVMADELNLTPRWRAFESLWGIPDLATKLTMAQYCKYYSDTLEQYARAMTT